MHRRVTDRTSEKDDGFNLGSSWLHMQRDISKRARRAKRVGLKGSSRNEICLKAWVVKRDAIEDLSYEDSFQRMFPNGDERYWKAGAMKREIPER